MSIHSEKRTQQRGIPQLIFQWLDEYGERSHDHNGAVILYFSKKGRRRLEKEVGRQVINRMNEWLNSYAVLSLDGTLITIGHRHQRIWH